MVWIKGSRNSGSLSWLVGRIAAGCVLAASKALLPVTYPARGGIPRQFKLASGKVSESGYVATDLSGYCFKPPSKVVWSPAEHRS